MMGNYRARVPRRCVNCGHVKKGRGIYCCRPSCQLEQDRARKRKMKEGSG